MVTKVWLKVWEHQNQITWWLNVHQSEWRKMYETSEHHVAQTLIWKDILIVHISRHELFLTITRWAKVWTKYSRTTMCLHGMYVNHRGWHFRMTLTNSSWLVVDSEHYFHKSAVQDVKKFTCIYEWKIAKIFIVSCDRLNMYVIYTSVYYMYFSGILWLLEDIFNSLNNLFSMLWCALTFHVAWYMETWRQVPNTQIFLSHLWSSTHISVFFASSGLLLSVVPLFHMHLNDTRIKALFQILASLY